jgi:RNA polymerase sigma factor (sigma-70 family)
MSALLQAFDSASEAESTVSDHSRVAAVRRGDDRAFEALYQRYQRRIHAYVYGMVKDHQRAEDVTQEVFVSALRRMRATERPIAFKPWVYEIAKNACIDQFRRARRAEEVSMDADEGLGSADYGRLVSSTPTPDVAHDHKQQIDHLRGAFGGLSETHHEILVMRELEGLSYREIGEKLGMTRPAVESTLFRARRRLTEEYDQLVTGERCVRVQQIIATAGGSALGARDKRRVARHVSYCQPCLRHARVSGIDAGDLVHKPIRQKIAAFLPLPAFLKERWGGDADPAAGASFAQWSAHASSVDPGLVSSWGKAAATAATIALAGVGAGVATNKDGVLPGSLGGVTLESITGQGNPGGSGADAVTQAGSDGFAAPGGSTGSGNFAAAGSGAGSSAGGGSSSSSASASDGGSAGASGGADGARDGVGALAGVGGDSGGSGTTAGGGSGDTGAGAAGGDAGTLLPSIGGSSSDSGPGTSGKQEKPKDGEQQPAIVPPSIATGVPSVGDGSGDSGGNPAKPDGNNGDGSGAGNADGDGGSPVEVIGDKSADVIGSVVGG